MDQYPKQLKLKQASSVTARKTHFLSIEPPIPLGTLTVIAGPSGIGKTTIAERYCAQVTTGDLDGIYKGKPQTVIILSPEDDEAAITRPRLEAAGADLDKIYFMSSTRRTETGEMEAMISVPADTPLLIEAVKQTNAATILLDPIASIIS
ncbi:AAA family ATPase, partial [Brevibacterium sediminis]|uniref:AAA family ATPase n=1 Tax=Brevibacterium sediminis TaxID=1857024 RepID=UPI003B3BC8A9